MIALHVMRHFAAAAFAPYPVCTIATRLCEVTVLAASAPGRFLVTGATGFIGRRLVERLLQRFGAESIACLVHDCDATTHAQRVAASRQINAGVRIIRGDLTRAAVSSDSPPEPEIVFHLAANIDTNATEAESRVNDEGTANLLRWLGPRLRDRRVMYASSVAVCDRNGSAEGPLDENSPVHPRTMYGRTKLRGEAILRREADRLQYSYTILRLPTVYGPEQKPGGMFDLLLRYAAERAWLGRLNWPGRSSILYVEDAAEVMCDLSMLHAAANETFCVASDEDLTIGEIARRVGGLTGHPIVPIDLPPSVWSIVRWIAWNRAVSALVPPFARVAYWRLGLIADDGFWQSAAKLRRVYPRRLMTLDEGVKRIIAAAQSRATVAS